MYAQMHGLSGSRDQTALRELLKLLPLPVPQNLVPIFPNDLELARASAEFGEAPDLWPPMLPSKGIALSSAYAAEGRWGLGTLQPNHYLSGPLILLLSRLGLIL